MLSWQNICNPRGTQKLLTITRKIEAHEQV